MAHQVGPYEIGEPLATLPFGTLFEVTRSGGGSAQVLALRVDDALARDSRFRGLLRLAMSRAGGVRDPALARSIEVRDDQGNVWIIYERPLGAVLSARLRDGPPLTAEESRSLLSRLAHAIDAAHNRRLAHGAVTPAAIIAQSDGPAVLVGLGVLVGADEAGLADAVRGVLAPDDAAPEQASGPLAIASADRYALGALAARLLSGPAPVLAPTNGDPRAALAADGPASDLSDDARAVLARQQDPAPDRRYPTCAAFVAALADALTPPPTPDAPTPPPTPRTGEGRPAADRPVPGAVPGRPRRLPPPPQPTAPAPSEIPPRRTERLYENVARFAADAPRGGAPWTDVGLGREQAIPTTTAMRECLRGYLTSSGPTTALAVGAPILFLAVAVVSGEPFFAIFAVVLGLIVGTPKAIMQVVRAGAARPDPGVVRWLGPIAVTRHVQRNRHGPDTFRYDLDIGGRAAMSLDESTFEDIQSYATPTGDSYGSVGALFGQEHASYEIARALVTYAPGANVLIDVRRPDGSLITANSHYRWDDPDV